MRIFHRSQHLTIWLACLALVLNTFLPLLANGLGAGMGFGGAVSKGGVIEICSVQGVKLIDGATGRVLKIDALKSGQEKQHINAHCAFCLPHADHDFVLPVLASVAVATNLGEIVPALFYQSPQTLFIWDSAQARAPPVLS